MSSSQRFLLLALLLLLLGGLGFGARWLFSGREPAPAPEPGRESVAVTPQAAPRPAERLSAGEVTERPKADPGSTTVTYPLEVELELVRPGALPTEPGVPAWGTAGRSRLQGFVFGEDNKGLAAQVEFVYGANTGRVLQCGADGAYGANDLHPGLSIVRIEGPGVLGSMREVLLRQEREQVLTVSYARPARISGEVIDRKGEPLTGAKVTLDGLVSITDSFGQFHFPQVAAGDALLVVEKDGFRAHREILPVTVGATYEIGRLRYALEPGASLEIVVPDVTGGSEEAYVYFFSKAGVLRDYPWFLVNPTRVWPGGRVRIDDLPPGRIDLRLFHSGAKASPELAVANLVPGSVISTEIRLKPAPMLMGVVRSGGEPVADARVTLEAADRIEAVLAALGEDYGILEGDVLPGLPPGLQEVRTDADGEFVLSSWASAAKNRYLTAVGPDGRSFAGKLLRGDEERVDLELSQRAQDSQAVTLRMGGRFQALPVRLVIRGEPRDEFLLGPDDDLVIDGLARGTWRMAVQWETEDLLDGFELELPGAADVDLALPLGAIEGQTGDIRKRSGRGTSTVSNENR